MGGTAHYAQSHAREKKRFTPISTEIDSPPFYSIFFMGTEATRVSAKSRSKLTPPKRKRRPPTSVTV